MILVDSHVHLYNCFDLESFFNSAFLNFQSEAARNGKEDDFSGVVFLTDWANQNWFRHFFEKAKKQKGKTSLINAGKWQFHNTHENNSLYVQNPEGDGFYLIAGRKVITGEGLELLALFTQEFFQDGGSLIELVKQIKKKGALPVIPWAPGKWMGRRGKYVKEMIETSDHSDILLCDNGNRPVFWLRPLLFKLAESRGIRIISGSDPLHFPSEVVRVGSYGFSFEGFVDPKEPEKDIKRYLTDPAVQFRMYGRQERAYRFLLNQTAMQLKKQKSRRELTNL